MVLVRGLIHDLKTPHFYLQILLVQLFQGKKHALMLATTFHASSMIELIYPKS
jgi:hypothetical protein